MHPSAVVGVVHHDKEIDVDLGGPYANYNWELLFHVPLTIAVHLSKNQRFAEAQQLVPLHLRPDVAPTRASRRPQRFWKFLRFRPATDPYSIDELLTLLSNARRRVHADQTLLKQPILDGYEAIKHNPFQPHAVARTRPLAYQYHVVMKYLDNLIAWGDSLFLQDTDRVDQRSDAALRAGRQHPRPAAPAGPAAGTVRAEDVRPAQGSRPRPDRQRAGRAGGRSSRSTSPRRSRRPATATPAARCSASGARCTSAFPATDKLLAYWDTVADRLFKIRHCMNIEGVVRQLALFDPPLDPGMLVKAAAAGIDIGSLVAGPTSRVGPLRALPLIQQGARARGRGASRWAPSLLSALREAATPSASRCCASATRSRSNAWPRTCASCNGSNAQAGDRGAAAPARERSWERYRYYLRLLGLHA